MEVPGVGLREFVFNGVFDQSATQTALYDSPMQQVVLDFLNGSNSSILAYGQTGSGKTHTMFGPPERNCNFSRNEEGVTIRAVREIFEVKNFFSKKIINFKGELS